MLYGIVPLVVRQRKTALPDDARQRRDSTKFPVLEPSQPSLDLLRPRWLGIASGFQPGAVPLVKLVAGCLNHAKEYLAKIYAKLMLDRATHLAISAKDQFAFRRRISVLVPRRAGVDAPTLTAPAADR